MAFYIDKYKKIKEKIENFATNNDVETINIIAVTKTQSISTVNEAYNSGIRDFGENKVQEADLKFRDLRLKYSDIKLHMIGPLQTNKVKKAINIFDFFHSLDRESLALEFSKFSNKIVNKSFFVQINTGKEIQKSGIQPNQASEFINYCTNKLNLKIIGLMCLPPIDDNPKNHFKMLKQLSEKSNIKHLSMGMSADYNIAMECGATYVRIGSGFFGKRN